MLAASDIYCKALSHSDTGRQGWPSWAHGVGQNAVFNGRVALS